MLLHHGDYFWIFKNSQCILSKRIFHCMLVTMTEVCVVCWRQVYGVESGVVIPRTDVLCAGVDWRNLLKEHNVWLISGILKKCGLRRKGQMTWEFVRGGISCWQYAYCKWWVLEIFTFHCAVLRFMKMYSILRFMFPDSNFCPKADCPGSYRGFFQSLQANTQTVHCIKPRPFSSISLLIHYSLIIRRYFFWATDCVVK
jgi:hypothetical protein